MTLPTLTSPRLALRPPDPDADAPPLAAILAEPEVAQWWMRMDLERIRQELEAEPGWVIDVDRAPAGWLVVTEETEPDYRHVAFDLFLGAGTRGRGLGPEALRLAIDHFAAAGHHRFTIDPAVANERAIRAYESIGFKPVGVMRAYERALDGSWRDALLMDLLAAELD
jgi:aminoglycoside 6'-N-acetyltransferase